MTFVNKLYVDFIDHRRNTQSFDLVYFTTYFITYQLLTKCHLESQVYKKTHIIPIQQSSLLAFGKGFWQNMVSGEGEDNTRKFSLISK